MTIQQHYNLSEANERPFVASIVEKFASKAVVPVAYTWDEMYEVRGVAKKSDSRCVIPTVFKSSAVGWTQQGRPKKTDAEAFTALVFDIDEGQFEQIDIETMIDSMGFEATYWSTWKARPYNMRWRVVFETDRPYDRKSHQFAWRSMRKAIEKNLGVRGVVDHLPQHITSLHALPSYCTGESGESDDWGGLIPNPIQLEGAKLSLDAAEATANLHHYLNASKRSGGSRRAMGEAKAPTPYVGRADAEGLAQEVGEWTEKRGANATPLPRVLDCIAYLLSLGSKLGAKNLGARRGSRLYACWWHLYRCGFEITDIEDRIRPLLEGQPYKYIKESMSHARGFSKEANTEWLRQTGHLADQVPYRTHRAAFEQYLKILARAKHLEEGGKISHADIATLVGVEVKVVVFWRSQLIEKGWLHKWGENISTHYRRTYGPETS